VPVSVLVKQAIGELSQRVGHQYSLTRNLTLRLRGTEPAPPVTEGVEPAVRPQAAESALATA
jgi:hypothetical protein